MEIMIVRLKESSIPSAVAYVGADDCSHAATMCHACEDTWAIDYEMWGVHTVEVDSMGNVSAHISN